MEEKKIFIVGCPRTGTGLLQKILNNSDKICILPETHFLHRFSSESQRNKYVKQIGDLSNISNVDKLVELVYTTPKISSYWQWLKRNVDRDTFRQGLLESHKNEAEIFSFLMTLYAQKKRGNTNGLVLGEKTPAHLYYVPTLLKWFPKAKIIHTFRDPRAITLSRVKKIKKKQMDLKTRFPLLPGWILNPLDLPVEVTRISHTWLNAARLHAEYKDLYVQNYYMVKYEELITEPETQLKQLMSFLDIPFENKLLEEVLVFGSSYEDKQRGSRGFDKQAIDRWKKHLNPSAKIWFSIVARKHLKRFGYMP